MNRDEWKGIDSRQAEDEKGIFLRCPLALFSGRYESGRLRMVRQGAMLHCLYAAKGSDSFQILESFAVGDAPIRELRLENVCSDANGTVDAILSKLTIRQGQ